jgi:hypothetical protein
MIIFAHVKSVLIDQHFCSVRGMDVSAIASKRAVNSMVSLQSNIGRNWALDGSIAIRSNDASKQIT